MCGRGFDGRDIVLNQRKRPKRNKNGEDIIIYYCIGVYHTVRLFQVHILNA